MTILRICCGRAGRSMARLRGRPRTAADGSICRCLRYSNMINGTEWLVVTKMDVMDECAEIPVCTGYRINGKVTDVIPADMRGFEAIQPIYTTLKGWNCSNRGHYGICQAAATGAGLLAVCREGVGSEDRDGLDRAG